MSAIEDLREFADSVVDGVNKAVKDTAPGSDPVPVLLLESGDELSVVLLPDVNLDQGGLKDVLFGAVFPDLIEKQGATKAAFASFAWLTILTKDEQAAIGAELREKGIPPSDTAAVREVAEDMGIKISGEDRRQEVCTVTAATLEAEAMLLGYVDRDEGVPSIEWRMEPPDEEIDGPGAVFVETDDPDKSQHGIGGRVIEGLRVGLTAVAESKGDWRHDD